MERKPLLLIALAFGAGSILLAWVAGLMVGTPAFGKLHVSATALVQGFWGTLPMVAGLWIVAHSQWPPVIRFRDRVDELAALFRRCTMSDLALISAMAGLSEEVLFRGVMQTALAEAVGIPVAVVVTGVVFGLLHYISASYAFYASVVGIYLGVLLVAFDNLLVPIVAHGVYDFIALVYLVRYRAKYAGVVRPGEDRPW